MNRAGMLVLLTAFALAGCKSTAGVVTGLGVGGGLIVGGAVVGRGGNDQGPSGEGYAAAAMIGTGLVVVLATLIGSAIVAEPER